MCMDSSNQCPPVSGAYQGSCRLNHQVVNPDYRQADGQLCSGTGKLNRRLAQFGSMALDDPIVLHKVAPFVDKNCGRA